MRRTLRLTFGVFIASVMFAACGGPVEPQDDLSAEPQDGIEQAQSAAAGCPADTRSCESCSGGRSRTKTVTWRVTQYIPPFGVVCQSTTTYGSCQPTCAF